VFFEDFESGYGAWTMDGIFNPESSKDPCGSLAAPFPTGQQGAWAGIESSCDFFQSWVGNLTLATPISIPDTNAAVKLRFWSYDDVECLSCGWDWRFVYARVAGTSQWDFIGESTSWLTWGETELDLSAYAGQDIELRFEFDGVDGVFNSGLGWLIDEVRVELEWPVPQVYCTPKLASDGCLATIGASGTAGFTTPTPFQVTATDVSENKNGLFFYGLAAAPFPFQGGWFCILPPTARTPLLQSGSTGAPCSGAYALDFNAYIQSVQPPFLTPGEFVYGQYWFRDPGDPFGSVRTDAVEFVLVP